MEGTPASSPEQLHIDVLPCGDTQSLAGYPKYAKDEAHAHLLAEEAVAELLQVADPGEYFVTVPERADARLDAGGRSPKQGDVSCAFRTATSVSACPQNTTVTLKQTLDGCLFRRAQNVQKRNVRLHI
jgi:hypothetical protein